VIVLKAKALTKVRLLKGLEGHRRMAEDKEGLEENEGAWTIDQPIQGNICGEAGDGDCVPDEDTSCGEGTTENKYGECVSGGFYFMLFGLISMIMI
jgi:hypothetical protein